MDKLLRQAWASMPSGEPRPTPDAAQSSSMAPPSRPSTSHPSPSTPVDTSVSTSSAPPSRLASADTQTALEATTGCARHTRVSSEGRSPRYVDSARPVLDERGGSVDMDTTSAVHVVALPGPGRGHINPMMNLCKLLASSDDSLLITFAVTEEWLGFIGWAPTPPNIRLRSIPNIILSELVRTANLAGFVEQCI
ncbi:UDP-glycosyltransferase 87A1-like protein [Cinnamomum micranthum f. kanehirae]|uniref:UDP-glycosyltransferase 87A1-like protein n=1 Tax=Cinnamomum micranthum f. kanehirae TaxID=337451 RepID=A0A443NBZ0_9MAGN|nr:UDP-glycosyltransferase 87A1-like protein [Cinnamomum micranthum f. kanehirae]